MKTRWQKVVTVLLATVCLGLVVLLVWALGGLALAICGTTYSEVLGL